MGSGSGHVKYRRPGWVHRDRATYRADHVGRVRIALAERIERELAERGYEVRVDPSKLYPALGRWRTDTSFDVKRWTGSIERRYEPTGRWLPFHVSSWDTMSDCVREKEWHVTVGRTEFEIGAT